MVAVLVLLLSLGAQCAARPYNFPFQNTLEVRAAVGIYALYLVVRLVPRTHEPMGVFHLSPACAQVVLLLCDMLVILLGLLYGFVTEQSFEVEASLMIVLLGSLVGGLAYIVVQHAAEECGWCRRGEEVALAARPADATLAPLPRRLLMPPSGTEATMCSRMARRLSAPLAALRERGSPGGGSEAESRGGATPRLRLGAGAHLDPSLPSPRGGQVSDWHTLTSPRGGSLVCAQI